MGFMFIVGCIDWEGLIIGFKKYFSSIGIGYMEGGGVFFYRIKYIYFCCFVIVVKGVIVVVFLKV